MVNTGFVDRTNKLVTRKVKSIFYNIIFYIFAPLSVERSRGALRRLYLLPCLLIAGSRSPGSLRLFLLNLFNPVPVVGKKKLIKKNNNNNNKSS